jgi:hypothetical protein
LNVATLTALTAFAAVLLGFVTAILGYLNQRRIKTTAAAAEVVAGKVQEISVNVDGRLSRLFERQAQLLGTLHESGIPIPPMPAEKTLMSTAPDAPPPAPPAGPPAEGA